MRILGLDIGAKSLKAVEIDSTFGRFDIHEYHERPLAVGDDTNLAISQLVSSLARAPDRIAVNIPAHRTTFRNLQLPSKDKKAIQSAVGFELEDELPFPMENAAYDFTILSQQKQGVRVHVAASLQPHVIEELTKWRNRGIDPDLITTEAWAYRTFLTRALASPSSSPASKAQPELPILLLNLGHEKSMIYGHWQGSPILAREINWGGKDLTQAIGQKYAIPLEAAEKAKMDRGFVAAPSQMKELSHEQIELSNTIAESLQGLLAETRQVELTCKSVSQDRPSIIYLSGGTSLLPGLARWLEENIKLPVRSMQGLSSITTSGVTYSEQADATFLLAAALALCQVGPERAAAINFRKGLFAKKGRAREFNLSRFRELAGAAAVVFACFVTSLAVQSTVYQSRIKEANAQLERSVRAFFGGQIAASAIRSKLASPGTLRTQISQELGKQRELAKLFQGNPHSPTDFLRDLSSSIPKSVVLDMIQYQVGAAPSGSYFKSDDNSTQLTFLLQSPQEADQLAGILSSKLAGMSKSGIEQVNTPDGPRSKITFSGKPNEASYGK